MSSAQRIAPRRFRVRALPPHALTQSDLQAWAALESRALEPNAFASPHFVMPALRYLDAHADALVLLVDGWSQGERQLMGAGTFTRGAASRLFPLPHLVGYQSCHSYLGGVLLDRAYAHEALTALLEHVGQDPRHNGLEIGQMWADGALAGMLSAEPDERGQLHREVGQDQRAVLYPAQAGEDYLQRAIGKRMKDLDRRRRRLAEQGEVGWRCHREGGIPDTVVERFLQLEHAGWKGENGSSLRSNPAEEAFFREAVARFGSENRAMFTELTLDGVAIASCVNFLSGRQGFGFKIGWDPAYKAYSPGILNEMEFVRRAPALFGHEIDCFDSGSSSDSYINELWVDRRPLCTATVTTHALAQFVTETAASARHIRRRLKTSRASTSALHVVKPEWVTVVTENLSTFSFLF